jgi:general secretion pathway protein H
MPATADPRDAGTTLIEALVVVTITTMVTLIGFPQLQQGLLTLSRRQTATAVVERLREARATAMLTDRPVVFALGSNGRVYGWRGQTSKTGPGVYLSAASGPIAFYADGTSSGGAVWVTAARRSYLVGVDGDNGAVDIWRK